MSHGSETRRQRGGKTGVAGRRSREGAGLGKQIVKDNVQGHPPKEAIKNLEQGWNTISHEWFGTDKLTFQYDMNKWDNRPVITDWVDNSTNQAPSLINKPEPKNEYKGLRIEKLMSKLKRRN